jgi:simple sugar transport system permease protein
MTSFVRRPEFGAFAAFILIYLFFAIATRGAGFVSLNGTAGWLNLAAELGIVAIPVGLLMIAGEFDLSIGSTVGCAWDVPDAGGPELC